MVVSFERTLQMRERVEMMIQYANENERTPATKLVMDGVRIGSFWQNMKRGQNSELLSECLSRSSLLRHDYERHLSRRSVPRNNVERHFWGRRFPRSNVERQSSINNPQQG